MSEAHGSGSPRSLRQSTLFVLLDGVGDVTAASLADARHPLGRTPLQAARTPNLDRLAAHGLTGLLDSVEAGQACGSDTAHLSLLGYDPLLFYRGRGAFESLGAGLDMQVGDVAFKSNFATIRPDGIVSKRRADRAFHEWGVPLCAALDGAVLPSFPDIQVSVRYATEHRCGVRLRGPGLTDCITGTDPLVDGRQLRVCRATTGDGDAERTARIVNEVSLVFQRILARHPINTARANAGLPVANVVLLRGAGARIQVSPFCEAQGIAGRAAMVAPTAIIAGLGASVGFDLLPCAGGTGDYRTDLLAKARTLLGAMRARSSPHRFGFLHVKAVDDAGHDRDLRRKIEFIERSDHMIGFIIDELRRPGEGGAEDTEWTVVVTGDHSTPVLYGDHAAEPVPVVVSQLHHLPEFAPQLASAHTRSTHVAYSSAMSAMLSSPSACAMRELATTSNVRSFDEIACAKGVLGRFPGRELMPLLRKMREATNPEASTAVVASQDHAHHPVPPVPNHPPVPQATLPMQPPQLQQHLLQQTPPSASPSSAAAAALPSSPALLPISSRCQPGLSPWQQECAALLPSFSPPADTPFPTESPVVVIGAGLSGLATALSLARRGLACVVLERGLIGSGATGRNGGHMRPVNADETAAVKRMFDTLAEYGVTHSDVEFRTRAGMELANEAEQRLARHDDSAGDAEEQQQREFGVPLSASEVRAMVHSSRFGSSRAAVDVTGAIHPVRLLASHAQILRDHFDTHVWQRTTVTSVARDPAQPNAWIVRTPRGEVRARVVVHATNAWVGELVPILDEHITRVRNHVMQTSAVHPPETIVPAAAHSSLTSASASPVSSPPLSHPCPSPSRLLWDGLSLGFHHGYDYMVQRPSGALVMGGVRYLAPALDTRVAVTATEEPLLPRLVDRLRSLPSELFPEVFSAPANSHVCATHLWSGVLAFTSSRDPLVGGVPNSPGQFALVGFSGHGMPRCPAAAEKIAEHAARYIASGATEDIKLEAEARGIPAKEEERILRAITGEEEATCSAHSAGNHSVRSAKL